MLEGNATVDWQVMGTSSWLVEENLGIEQCIEDTHAGTLDLSTECELELAGRECEMFGIDGQTSVGSKNFVTTTLYDDAFTRDKIGRCIRKVSSIDLVF
ncbi:hypothetical protein V6N12_031046 [Hibiscus sabdariffa]|uniref:Uncharacterized protein n=1 Tax=Hibiscus sabdariffa TaxID=183260 RepID=A0ABR2E7U2_9ROSI